MTASTTAEPSDPHAGAAAISTADAAALLTPLAAFDHVVLAVSGGADSMALLRLAAAVFAGSVTPTMRPRLTVATIDHGLRATSRTDTRFVAAACRELGLPLATLTWRHAGPPPTSGLLAAARDARYALLERYARSRRIPALVTAHHADDLAETVLMRLSRGSGPDGLAAMRPATPLGGTILLRPLLGVSRACLEATARALAPPGAPPWREDPTNQDERHERVRLRSPQAIAARRRLGLSTQALRRTAARAVRGEASRSHAARELLRLACVNRQALSYAAAFHLELARLRAAPADLQVAALQLAFTLAGGAGACPLAKAEDALARLESGAQSAATFTLHGAHVSVHRGILRLRREWGRCGLPTQPLTPREPIVWDGRFMIVSAPDQGAPGSGADLLIGALGADHAGAGTGEGTSRPPHLSRAEWSTVPALVEPSGDDATPPLRQPLTGSNRQGPAPLTVFTLADWVLETNSYETNNCAAHALALAKKGPLPIFNQAPARVVKTPGPQPQDIVE